MKFRYHIVRWDAFTLVEVLFAALTIPLVMASIITGTLFFTEIGSYAEDVCIAQDRAEHTFSLMKLPIDHSGYGLPKDASEYKAAFGSGLGKPFSWNGPMSVEDATVGGNIRKNAACRIAYGIPSMVYVKSEVVTSSDTLELSASGMPDLLETTAGAKAKPSAVKNWVLAGSMLPYSRPFWITSAADAAKNGKKLSLRWNKPLGFSEEIFIPENDELFYLGAVECRVLASSDGDYIFYMEDYRGGGRQPRQEGVIDARFEIDSSKKMLKVHLLVRGERRYDEIKTTGTPVGWPEKYASDIPDLARRYRLFAFSESFALKNF
jgi:hypothetical protein